MPIAPFNGSTADEHTENEQHELGSVVTVLHRPHSIGMTPSLAREASSLTGFERSDTPALAPLDTISAL